MKTIAKADDFEKEVECFGEAKLFRASWMRDHSVHECFLWRRMRKDWQNNKKLFNI